MGRQSAISTQHSAKSYRLPFELMPYFVGVPERSEELFPKSVSNPETRAL